MKKHTRNLAVLLLALCLLPGLFSTSLAALPAKGPLKAITDDSGTLADLDLSISTAFQITRPASGELTTTYASYFITGTSDPSRPVYYNGTAIDRQGSKGTFGVLVALQIGANQFTFRQGDISQTVTITRRQPGSGKIAQITQASMFPKNTGAAKAGQMLSVYCTAPSGSSVTASFGGASVSLKQVASASAGLPAEFKGQLQIGTDYDADITQNAGPITYKLTYNGSTSSYKSTGDMYIAGQNSRAAMRVTSYQGFVYPDYSNKLIMQNLLAQGAVDYIKGQTNDFFILSSGGAIPSDMVEVIEGTVNIRNQISTVTTSIKNRAESYSFAGTTLPAYKVNISENIFQIIFYNSTGAPTPSVASSKLFSSVSAKSSGENNTVTYTFDFSNRSLLWGYHVTFDGKNTVLTLNSRPSLSTIPGKPLTGIVVLVDPGHGGSDPGALGVAGKSGPYEKTINLAHSYAIRDALKELGATVYLTRSSDLHYSMDERMNDIERADADFFLSVHHNSIAESGDANKASGVEIYYHTGYSKNLAQNMLSAVVNGTGRKSRSATQSYYRVTLLRYCPAVLMELGFMSNPLEYERMTDIAYIKQMAQSVADGIVATLQ
jgi:N-acetylmuramoyl-L-alanine amidase